MDAGTCFEVRGLRRGTFSRLAACLTTVIVTGALLLPVVVRASVPASSCTATAASMTPTGWAAPRLPSRASASLPLKSPLIAIADVPLPGAARRFDYVSIDSVARRLYISHMYGARLVVFDLQKETLVTSIEGFPGATGVIAVPALRRIFVSVTGRKAVDVVDDQTFRTVAKISGARFPDGLAYVPELQRIFVSDESGEKELVIDAVRAESIGTVTLAGEAGNSHYDAVSRCVLVAVQSRDELVAIDPSTMKIVRHFHMPCKAPHGFLIDAPRRVAFVTCEEDARLLVVDLRTMQVSPPITVGPGPDVLAFDAGLGRLYVASEGGVVTVLAYEGGKLARLGDYRTPHAHSVAVDPHSHHVYLPLEDVSGRPVLRILRAADQH
ncbi:MAG: hypothetical protein ABIT38_01115 [Gemmatimonadaceae bacterium]